MKKYKLFIALSLSVALVGCSKSKADTPAATAQNVSVDAEEASGEVLDLDDDWYEVADAPQPVDTSPGKVELEQVYDYEKGEAQQITFTSREQNAANNLPYYFKNIRIERKNKKDFTIAEPDTATVGELYVTEFNTSLRNVAKAASDNNYEELLQIVATIMPQTANSYRYLEYFFQACTLYEKNLHGVEKIEREDGVDLFTGYDKEKHKIEVTISTSKYKFANSGPMISEELQSQVSQRLYEKLGILLPEEAERMEERKAEEEAEELKEAAEEEKRALEEIAKSSDSSKVTDADLQKQGELLQLLTSQAWGQSAGTNTAAYKTFTDKKGATASYTKEEWDYLISFWAYIGHDIEQTIMDHSHDELRSLLNKR